MRGSSLLFVGMIAGCSTRLPPPEKPATPPPRADLGPLMPLGIREDRVGPRDRPVQTDGDPDFAFRVRVSGEVDAFILIGSDPAGVYRGGEVWDTLTPPAIFPPESDIHAPTQVTSALAIVDDRGVALNPDTTLGHKRFEDAVLTISAHDPGHAHFKPGRSYSLLVVRPDRIDRTTTTLL